MKTFDFAVIRELVNAAFDDESLSVFCHDHFGAVYEKFAVGQTKGQRVLMLVDYAERNGLAERMLSLTKKSNPYQYEKFESRLKSAPMNGEAKPSSKPADPFGKQPMSPAFYVILSFFVCLIGGGLVINGFWLVPISGAFDVTVYVHGPGGKTDRVLTNRGKVILELGQFPRTSPIRENGDAHFDGIPSDFFKQEVLAMIDAEGFEPAKRDTKLLLYGERVYFEVRRDSSLAKIVGTVKNKDGNFLKGVTIRIGKLKTQTDADGRFELTVPPDAQKERQKLTARLEGHETWVGIQPAFPS